MASRSWFAVFVVITVWAALTALAVVYEVLGNRHYPLLFTAPLWGLVFWWTAIGALRRSRRSGGV